jgi:hypothetical protein
MSETLKKMQTYFGEKAMPKELPALCRYFDRHTEFFAGSFEVYANDYQEAEAWLKGKKDASAKIRVFGVDGTHSLFALWVGEGIAPDKAPVLYLAGDSDGSTVLAAHFRDFLSLLATNQDYEPFDRNFCEAAEENEEENGRFKKWLKKMYGISPAKRPMDIVKKGRKKHPAVVKWLKAQMKANRT